MSIRKYTGVSGYRIDGARLQYLVFRCKDAILIKVRQEEKLTPALHKRRGEYAEKAHKFGIHRS